MNEICLGKSIAECFKVGDSVYASAAAPGSGHIIYQITRIDEQGRAWGIVIEDTMFVR